MNNFKVSIERRRVLGRELRSKRIGKQLTLKQVGELSELEINYLKNLEAAKIEYINPLILIRLGEIFEINYMLFYQILGYVNNIAVIRYFTVQDDIYPFFDDKKFDDKNLNNIS